MSQTFCFPIKGYIKRIKIVGLLLLPCIQNILFINLIMFLYFRVPVKEPQSTRWKMALGLDLNSKSKFKVCSLHFHPNDFKYNRDYRTLKPDVFPDLNKCFDVTCVCRGSKSTEEKAEVKRKKFLEKFNPKQDVIDQMKKDKILDRQKARLKKVSNFFNQLECVVFYENWCPSYAVWQKRATIFCSRIE